jgi:uncharacterized protein
VPQTPPRYAPRRPFPPYAFLPGRDPHPTGDPRGHSYGTTESRPPYCPSESWASNEVYLFGVDLYNHGYLWEAHEAWEGLWHSSKRDPTQAEFLQGLIQCTAAALKVRMAQPRGLERLAELGTARCERVAQVAGDRYMGLDVPEFVHQFRAFAASRPANAEARPLLVIGPSPAR